MKNVLKATKIIAKILEIVHWFAAVSMALIAFCTFTTPQWRNLIVMDPGASQPWMSAVYGFEATLTDASGQLSLTALCLAAIGAAVIYGLVAMIFRNINLIMGRSEKGSPFQGYNIQMMREIGFFSIAIPVAGLVMSVIIRLVMGPGAARATMHPDSFVTGIIVLILTQFFVYGAQLAKELDGLL